ncbi:MAG TPA: hypothetical protein VG104_02200 [Candidatus Dormibacteraeota bacterium]|jgi:uncharacterized membrane protein|nr:hypothetical protein [Candidatus Dormibacteraeota bacterium]
MRRTISLALLSGVMIALAATLAAGSSRHAAVADEGCSNASVRGAYGFADQGQAFTAGGGEGADIAAAGRIVFDGKGGLTGTEWESFNGAITTIPFSGEYSVQPDCTGQTVIHDGQTAHLKFTLVERGQEANYFITDPGVVAAGQISRVQLKHCSNATLRGVYSFAASGSAVGASGELGDIAVSARIVFDGRGTATQSTSSSFNGFQNEAAAESSTYSVNPDCTGSAILSHADGTMEHINFVIVEGGGELKFFVNQPGIVFTGTVDKAPLGD